MLLEIMNQQRQKKKRFEKKSIHVSNDYYTSNILHN